MIAAGKQPPVQAVPLSDAQFCMDCEHVSNTRTNECPVCTGKSLWPLSHWVKSQFEKTA